MAGAIGLSGIHNVTGICDLCGVKCNPNKEDLNALDCTYKECRSMVYHQDCLEKYLKSIRLEKNRKTGFKCPRGCGKGTRFSEGCRGKVDKSHPIHVRHEQITRTKNEKTGLTTKKNEEVKTTTTQTKKTTMKAPNLVDLNLLKLLPSKSEEQNSEWKVSLTRSKSLDKGSLKSTSSKSLGTPVKSRSRRSTGSISFTSPKKANSPRRQKSLNEELNMLNNPTEPDAAKISTEESLKSQVEHPVIDFTGEESSENGSQKHSLNSCESPDTISQTPFLPAVDEETKPKNTFQVEKTGIHENCEQCLREWKSTALIKQLYRMGFEMWRSSSAVEIFGSNIEEAIRWLVENRDYTHDQVNMVIRQQHLTKSTSSSINIEFELQTILSISKKYQMDESLLESAVVQFEGDLNSAIRSIVGSKEGDYIFPDCDLSLGIVYSESSPYLHERLNGKEEEVHTDVLSDDLMLGCVLGSALEDYKRGNVDFTDLVNKDLSYYEHLTSSGRNSSPMSPCIVPHSPCSSQVSSYCVQQHQQQLQQYPPSNMNDAYSVDYAGSYGSLSNGTSIQHHGYSGIGNCMPVNYPMTTTSFFASTGAGDTTTSMELRHFIGDILE